MGRPLARSTLHQQQMFAREDGLSALIQNFQRFDHHSVTRLLVLTFFFDRDSAANCVANEHWFNKAQPVVTVAERERIDFTGGHSNRDAENQSAVRNALAE